MWACLGLTGVSGTRAPSPAPGQGSECDLAICAWNLSRHMCGRCSGVMPHLWNNMVHQHPLLVEAAQIEVTAGLGPGLQGWLCGSSAMATVAWRHGDLKVMLQHDIPVANAHVL